MLSVIETLRNNECSVSEKLLHFNRISSLLMHPSAMKNPNYQNHLREAINILLLFCEEDISVIRMNAEENLIKVFRLCESNNNLLQVQIHLYSEIKKNGNERSLRICLNLFSYSMSRIKQSRKKTFAKSLYNCILEIAKRKESLLVETFMEFFKVYCDHLLQYLGNMETRNFVNLFQGNLTSDCQITRRCSAQNLISVINNSERKKSLVCEVLQKILSYIGSSTSSVGLLGNLELLRLLTPLVTELENNTKVYNILYSCCEILNSSCNQSVLTSTLEVVNVILKATTNNYNLKVFLSRTRQTMCGIKLPIDEVVPEHLMKPLENPLIGDLSSTQSTPMKLLQSSKDSENMFSIEMEEETLFFDNISEKSTHSENLFETPSKVSVGKISCTESAVTANDTFLDDSDDAFSNLSKSISTETSKEVIECVPIDYIVKLIASKFLLAGTPKTLTNDEKIRVSLKNSSLAILTSCMEIDTNLLFMKIPTQSVSDVIYYAFHEDPLIRANVMMLIGKYLKSLLSQNVDLKNYWQLTGSLEVWKLKNVLKILVKGLLDKNYIVVKHAMTVFEEILNELIGIAETEIPNDKSVAQLEATDGRLNRNEKIFLLDLLFSSCHDENFWIVRLKYCDIIGSIDYNKLELMLGKEKRHFYEHKAMENLLKLVVTDDARIRNQACLKLVDVVNQNSGNSILTKLLYKLCNMLLNFQNKNEVLGSVQLLKTLQRTLDMKKFYQIWQEFDVFDILVSFLKKYGLLALDIGFQMNVIEIIGNMLFTRVKSKCPVDTNFLMGHLMKILNIYTHLLTNTKPVKPNPNDLFTATFETQSKCLGFFYDDFFYMKLYAILKNIYENFRVSVNSESDVTCRQFLVTTLKCLQCLLDVTLANDVVALKFETELIGFLKVLINFEEEEAIETVKKLICFLLDRNWAADVDYYEKNVKPLQENATLDVFDLLENATVQQNLPVTKITQVVPHFNTIIIQCLKTFPNTSLSVQSKIIGLLCQLLTFNVEYISLDAKNVFLNYLMQHIDVVKSENPRSADVICPAIIRFLYILAKSENTDSVTHQKIFNLLHVFLQSMNIRLQECGTEMLITVTEEIFIKQPLESMEGKCATKCECTQMEICMKLLMENFENPKVQKCVTLLVKQNIPSYGCKSIKIVEIIFDAVLSILRNGDFEIENELMVNLLKIDHKQIPGEILKEMFGIYVDSLREITLDYQRLSILSIFNAYFVAPMDRNFFLACLDQVNIEFFVELIQLYFQQCFEFAVTTKCNTSAIELLLKLNEFAKCFKKLKIHEEFHRTFDLVKMFKISSIDSIAIEFLITFCLEIEIDVERLVAILCRAQYLDKSKLRMILMKNVIKTEKIERKIQTFEQLKNILEIINQLIVAEESVGSSGNVDFLLAKLLRLSHKHKPNLKFEPKIKLIDLFCENQLNKIFPTIFHSILQLENRPSNGPRDPCDFLDDDSIRKFIIRSIAIHSNDKKYENLTELLIKMKNNNNLNFLESVEIPLVRMCMKISFDNMLRNFFIDCVQKNPHVSYLKMTPLLQQSIIVLKMNVANFADEIQKFKIHDLLQCISTFLKCVKKLRKQCLNHIEAKCVQKFITENLLDQDFVEKLLALVNQLVNNVSVDTLCTTGDLSTTQSILTAIWMILSECSNVKANYIEILDIQNLLKVLYKLMSVMLQHNQFFRNFEHPTFIHELEDKEFSMTTRKIIFLAEFWYQSENRKIEAKSHQSMRFKKIQSHIQRLLRLLLRSENFYKICVIPYEILVNYTLAENFHDATAMKEISVEHLKDVSLLEKYIKINCLLGCMKKKQFEEAFTTLLLLLNENHGIFEDAEIQFRFKQLCLYGMVTLIVESCFKCSLSDDLCKFYFQSSRFELPDSKKIWLQKLKINQIVTDTQKNSIFNESNLEKVKFNSNNLSILSEEFGRNQLNLDYVWQKDGTDLINENIKFLLARNGIDVESFLHLTYDVFTELVKTEPIILLNPLALLLEICNNNDTFKVINEPLLELIEDTLMEEFITHQYIFTLISKCSSVIVPTITDLNYLQPFIYRYINSNHILLDISLLRGFACFLECFLKTSTCLGKLSDEILLLKAIIVDYAVTQKRLITKVSPSFEEYSKMIWSLSFFLLESTYKFAPDSYLESFLFEAAVSSIKDCSDLNFLYLLLNGLERFVVSAPEKTNSVFLSSMAIDLIKQENNLRAFGGLKALTTSLYVGNSEHIEAIENMNGTVQQSEPEIILRAMEDIELVFARIRSAAPLEATVFGLALSQIVNDLLPACEILTRLLKEFINTNQENIFVIAEIIHKVFRQTIESSHLTLLKELITSGMGMEAILQFRNSRKSIWALTVILMSTTCNAKLLKLYPIILNPNTRIEELETLHMLALSDLLASLNSSQKQQYRDVFSKLFKIVFGSKNFVDHKI